MQTKHLQASVRKRRTPLISIAQLLPFTLLLVVVAIVAWLWHRLQNPQAYPIQQIKIVASAPHVPISTLQRLVKGHVHGGFFSLDSEALKSGLMDNPWVKSVALRRIWPGTLVVSIMEHVPVARWGQSSVLTQDGTIFAVKQASSMRGLPEIEGPIQAKDDIMQMLQTFSQGLQAIHETVNKIDVSQRLAWQLTLGSGLKVNLCREQVASHFRDFVKVYPELLAPHIQDVVSVNLCYPNGLAVHWRDGVAPTVKS